MLQLIQGSMLTLTGSALTMKEGMKLKERLGSSSGLGVSSPIPHAKTRCGAPNVGHWNLSLILGDTNGCWRCKRCFDHWNVPKISKSF